MLVDNGSGADGVDSSFLYDCCGEEGVGSAGVGVHSVHDLVLVHHGCCCCCCLVNSVVVVVGWDWEVVSALQVAGVF